MNRYICSGRLTKDADIKTVISGEKERRIAKFTLAVDRKLSKEKREAEGVVTADFIPCVAYDGNARFIEQYIKKGNAVVIEGRITTGSYIDKEGNKCYTWDVVVDSIEFGNNGKSESSDVSQPVAQPQQMAQPVQAIPQQMVQPVQAIPQQMVQPVQAVPQQMVQPIQAVPQQMAQPVQAIPQQMVQPVQAGFFDISTGAVEFN